MHTLSVVAATLLLSSVLAAPYGPPPLNDAGVKNNRRFVQQTSSLPDHLFAVQPEANPSVNTGETGIFSLEPSSNQPSERLPQDPTIVPSSSYIPPSPGSSESTLDTVLIGGTDLVRESDFDGTVRDESSVHDFNEDEEFLIEKSVPEDFIVDETEYEQPGEPIEVVLESVPQDSGFIPHFDSETALNPSIVNPVSPDSKLDIEISEPEPEYLPPKRSEEHISSHFGSDNEASGSINREILFPTNVVVVSENEKDLVHNDAEDDGTSGLIPAYEAPQIFDLPIPAIEQPESSSDDEFFRKKQMGNHDSHSSSNNNQESHHHSHSTDGSDLIVLDLSKIPNDDTLLASHNQDGLETKEINEHALEGASNSNVGNDYHSSVVGFNDEKIIRETHNDFGSSHDVDVSTKHEEPNHHIPVNENEDDLIVLDLSKNTDDVTLLTTHNQDGLETKEINEHVLEGASHSNVGNDYSSSVVGLDDDAIIKEIHNNFGSSHDRDVSLTHEERNHHIPEIDPVKPHYASSELGNTGEIDVKSVNEDKLSGNENIANAGEEFAADDNIHNIDHHSNKHTERDHQRRTEEQTSYDYDSDNSFSTSVNRGPTVGLERDEHSSKDKNLEDERSIHATTGTEHKHQQTGQGDGSVFNILDDVLTDISSHPSDDKNRHIIHEHSTSYQHDKNSKQESQSVFKISEDGSVDGTTYKVGPHGTTSFRGSSVLVDGSEASPVEDHVKITRVIDRNPQTYHTTGRFHVDDLIERAKKAFGSRRHHFPKGGVIKTSSSSSSSISSSSSSRRTYKVINKDQW